MNNFATGNCYRNRFEALLDISFESGKSDFSRFFSFSTHKLVGKVVAYFGVIRKPLLDFLI